MYMYMYVCISCTGAGCGRRPAEGSASGARGGGLAPRSPYRRRSSEQAPLPRSSARPGEATRRALASRTSPGRIDDEDGALVQSRWGFR